MSLRRVRDHADDAREAVDVATHAHPDRIDTSEELVGERHVNDDSALSVAAVGRALLGKPRLLLLDEPSMGLAPVLVDLIFHTIGQIRDQGVTVLLVEQNALAALEVADYAYVLESGNLTLQGPAEHMLENDSLTRAYLGG